MASKAEKAEAKPEDGVWEIIKVVVQALLIAFCVRLFLFQPFNIPSESMVPTLRVGDYLFTNKLSYGYGPHSFSFPVGFRSYKTFVMEKLPFTGRVLEFGKPERGDVVVFKLPSNTKIDYIKRLIGLPGDKIQMRGGVLYLNDKAVKRQKIEDFIATEKFGQRIEQFRETLPNGVSYVTHNLVDFPGQGADNTEVFAVPKGHYFMIGDNRDNSLDSRFANGVGFVPYENLVGRATILFFSHTDKASFWQFWKWPWTIRWSRIFSRVHG